MAKKRRKRRSRLAGVVIDEDKPVKKEPEAKEVQYNKFKTKLGKKWANYFVAGPIQISGNWAVDELKMRIKQTGMCAVIKARSFEEAFTIYYMYVCTNWNGGIHPLMELGLGKIKEFKPKFIHKEKGSVWYYDITTYIEKLKANKKVKQHKVAPLCVGLWFKANKDLLPEDKAKKLRKLRNKVRGKKKREAQPKKRKRKKRGKE